MVCGAGWSLAAARGVVFPPPTPAQRARLPRVASRRVLSTSIGNEHAKSTARVMYLCHNQPHFQAIDLLLLVQLLPLAL